MLPEEKILTYSILSLVGGLVTYLPNNEIEIFVKPVGLIISFVFYCLALAEIRFIKKNVYYKLSIAFLVVTSYIYARLFLIFILLSKDLIHFLKNISGIEMASLLRSRNQPNSAI